MLAQILSEKTVLIVVTLLGMGMCSLGIGQVAASGQWMHPMAIVAYLIGALVLVIAGAGIFNVPLPLIDSTRAALFAVILLAVIKVALTQLHHAFA